MTELPLLIAAPLAVLCAAIIYVDLRCMRIPDVITGAVVVLFVIYVALSYPAVPMVAQLITAAVTFAICFGLFAARIMGGGDTKVIPALALFVPLAGLSSIMLLFAACLMASIALVLALRRIGGREDHRWKVLASQKLPMGVAIGSTGLIALALSQV